MTNTKRGPYKGADYKYRKEITVDEHTVDVLSKYGNGNFSAGIRKAAVLVESETAKRIMMELGKTTNK